MATAAGELAGAGDRALAEGAWPAARDAYRASLEASETADALVGLGTALWWLGETSEAIECRERAYRAFSEQGDPLGAAMVARQLAMDYWDNLGNAAAGRGWLERTRRLADDLGLEQVRGWVLLLDARFATDPKESEQLAERCVELARAGGDTNLAACALSELGAALVEQGRVTEGVRLLDEAMAGSLAGEVTRPEPVVYASCTTLHACTASGDFTRAVQWLRATDRFAERFGGPYLGASCRIRYGTILVAIGDWAQAEEELTAAIRFSAGALPALHAEALAALAALRLAQGRVEEAARLVDGLEGAPGAAAVIGGVYLRQGRPESARSVLQRGLAMVGADRLSAVALRELLGEALVSCGEQEEALAHGDALTQLGADGRCQVATAHGRRLWGQAIAAAGDPAGARRHVDAALATFAELAMPYEAARTRLLLARLLRDDSAQAAVDEARTALAALDALGAAHEADSAAALLRELGAIAGRGSPTRVRAQGVGTLTRRELEVLVLLGEGLSNPQIAERLYLSRKTVEHHVGRVLTKLGLRSRGEATAEAVRRGLVGGGSPAPGPGSRP